MDAGFDDPKILLLVSLPDISVRECMEQTNAVRSSGSAMPTWTVVGCQMLVPVSGADTIGCERVGGGLDTGVRRQVVSAARD